MDWALHNHQGERRNREPRLERLRAYWRIVGPSEKPTTCGLFHTKAGLEVRVERTAEDLLFSQLVPSEQDGDPVADGWKRAFLAMGGFTELDVLA